MDIDEKCHIKSIKFPKSLKYLTLKGAYFSIDSTLFFEGCLEMVELKNCVNECILQNLISKVIIMDSSSADYYISTKSMSIYNNTDKINELTEENKSLKEEINTLRKA